MFVAFKFSGSDMHLDLTDPDFQASQHTTKDIAASGSIALDFGEKFLFNSILLAGPIPSRVALSNLDAPQDGSCTHPGGTTAWVSDSACNYSACSAGVSHHGCAPHNKCRQSINTSETEECKDKADGTEIGDGWKCYDNGGVKDRDCPAPAQATSITY